MRPRIADYLNGTFGTSLFDSLVPFPTLIYALAMLLCLLLFVGRSRQAGLEPYHAAGAAVTAMIGGLIGARVLFVILNVRSWGAVPGVLVSSFGGTVSWGAYLGGLLGLSGYLVARRQPVLPHMDALGSLLGMGPFIGRWACLLNGDDCGRVTSLPWASQYPPGSMPFAYHVRSGLIEPSAALSLPVHPVQLYLSACGLVLFLIFTRLRRKMAYPVGVVFFGYWVAYSFVRFWLEFFRGHAQFLHFGVFTTGQVGTLVALALGSAGPAAAMKGSRPQSEALTAQAEQVT